MADGIASRGTALTLKDRKTLTIEGVKDVLSFDDRGLTVQTDLGRLDVDGEELHVAELSVKEGRMVLEGRIDGLFFDDGAKKKKAGLFGGRG